MNWYDQIRVPRDEPFAQVSAEVIAARISAFGAVDQVGHDGHMLIYEIQEDDKWSKHEMC